MSIDKVFHHAYPSSICLTRIGKKCVYWSGRVGGGEIKDDIKGCFPSIYTL